VGININIDFGNLVPYAVDSFLKFLGKDSEAVELKEWFRGVQQIGLQESSVVMVIGMHSPLPLESIYQPTRLILQPRVEWADVGTTEAKQIEVQQQLLTPDRFLEREENGVLFAGPGWGKTTLLHYLFMKTLREEKHLVPVLFTLRRPGGLADFRKFVGVLRKLTKRSSERVKFLLLVDGYDEVSSADRKEISDALLLFGVSGVGHYLLTCRDFYDVYELTANRLRIGEFSTVDQLRYVTAFSGAYGHQLDGAELLKDLRQRGLGDLLRHPLLLAMVCIVKTGKVGLFSRSVLGLIARAIETLSFRWDEGKGVARETRIPLDGRDRINCLMRIAYNVEETRVRDSEALALAKEQLELLSCEHLDVREVLYETARFYGILVPTADGHWEFVHKTLHDYLAAKFWVETGRFKPQKISVWNTKAAYAACLSPDATAAMIAALSSKESLPAFAEMLSNEASFDHKAIGNQLIAFYGDQSTAHFFEAQPDRISVQLSQDFISIASTKFLLHIVDVCASARSRVKDTLSAYALAELVNRELKLPPPLYSRLLGLYKLPKFAFRVHRIPEGWCSFLLNQLQPG
jgi:hypothetical protein